MFFSSLDLISGILSTSKTRRRSEKRIRMKIWTLLDAPIKLSLWNLSETYVIHIAGAAVYHLPGPYCRRCRPRPVVAKHMHRLVEVLQRIYNAGLNLKPDKCRLLQPEVVFLCVRRRRESRPYQRWQSPQLAAARDIKTGETMCGNSVVLHAFRAYFCENRQDAHWTYKIGRHFVVRNLQCQW